MLGINDALSTPKMTVALDAICDFLDIYQYPEEKTSKLNFLLIAKWSLTCVDTEVHKKNIQFVANIIVWASYK